MSRTGVRLDMMKLPKTLKIGAYDVGVTVVPNLIRDSGCVGRFVPCEKRIEIEEAMCDQMKAGVLWHEIVEAFTEIYTIKALAEDHDAIDALGEAIHMFMKGNSVLK